MMFGGSAVDSAAADRQWTESVAAAAAGVMCLFMPVLLSL